MAMDESMVFIVREMLIMVMRISAPILMAGLLVGLLISLVQSVTSIQDQTLTFVPKIAVMVLVSAILIPWIAIQLVQFSQDMFALL
jgi:flagellar biosynthetic protein FliQ